VVPRRLRVHGLSGGSRGGAGGPATDPASLGLNHHMRKRTVWGPGLVPAMSPVAAAPRLHLEEGTEVMGIPIHSPVYASAVEAHLGKLGAKFARTCSAVGGQTDSQSVHALLRNCLGTAKVQSALRTLSLRQTAAFSEGVTVTQRSTWNALVGAPVLAAARVQSNLPISEGGCGVASASEVGQVARLAGVKHFFARAEPQLGCERRRVVPLATEGGLLDALNARLQPTLEPLASWRRTSQVELPDEDVRPKH